MGKSKKMEGKEWLNDWSRLNPGEAMLNYLIFTNEYEIHKYFNKRYPEDTKDFSLTNTWYKHYDFKKEKWLSYNELNKKGDINEQER